jgi:hypothetical protein
VAESTICEIRDELHCRKSAGLGTFSDSTGNQGSTQEDFMSNASLLVKGKRVSGTVMAKRTVADAT